MILYLEFIVRMYGFALIYIIIRCFVLYGIASLIVCVCVWMERMCVRNCWHGLFCNSNSRHMGEPHNNPNNQSPHEPPQEMFCSVYNCYIERTCL